MKIKKQCAIPNCSNPKCPFPHPTAGDKLKSPTKPKAYFKPLPLTISPVSHAYDPAVFAHPRQVQVRPKREYGEVISEKVANTIWV